MSFLSMISRAPLIAPFSLLLMLAACGGGAGSTGSDGSSPGGGNGGSSSGGAATSVVYETVAYPMSTMTTDGLAAQLNAEGARGYTWVDPIAYPGDAGAEFVLYGKTDTNTFTYEVLSMPATLADMLTQANAEGARGFARGTVMVAGISSTGMTNGVVLYRHVVGSTAVFSYESLTPPTSDADFLAQANAEGARGFFFNGEVAEPGSLVAAFYVKDSSSTAVYAYTAQPLNASSADFLTQANAQGALGYRFYSAYFFTGQTSSIYVKDTTQSSQFVFSAQDAINHSADYVTQANAQGANGLRLYGEFQFGSTPQDFYFLPKNCTGLLCALSSTF